MRRLLTVVALLALVGCAGHRPQTITVKLTPLPTLAQPHAWLAKEYPETHCTAYLNVDADAQHVTWLTPCASSRNRGCGVLVAMALQPGCYSYAAAQPSSPLIGSNRTGISLGCHSLAIRLLHRALRLDLKRLFHQRIDS